MQRNGIPKALISFKPVIPSNEDNSFPFTMIAFNSNWSKKNYRRMITQLLTQYLTENSKVGRHFAGKKIRHIKFPQPMNEFL